MSEVKLEVRPFFKDWIIVANIHTEMFSSDRMWNSEKAATHAKEQLEAKLNPKK